VTGQNWLRVERSNSPLILALPHGGTMIPADLEPRFVSPWWATRDADWYIGDVYAGLADATIVSTAISRSVIDANRDPSGASLYPGQATTELCPTMTFDGDPLYLPGNAPQEAEVAHRRAGWFDPYHAALTAEVDRLRAAHSRVVVYDCHSIRSRIPRLFDGELPQLNIGTNNGATCDPALSDAVVAACATSGREHVLNGRFKGGWTTRHYGNPRGGVHAIQMELATRTYLREPDVIEPDNWPPPYDAAFAAPLRATLSHIFTAIFDFAKGHA
jgi:N-formylglutamate deformylase